MRRTLRFGLAVAAATLALVPDALATGARARRGGPAADDAEAPSNVLILSNPLGHVRSLLDLPGAAAFLQGPPGKRLGVKTALAELRQALTSTAPYWPREVTLGMPGSAFSDLDAVVRMFMFGALCQGAGAAGVAGRADFPKLQKELATALRQVRVPAVRIWIDFGDERTATLVAEGALAWLQSATAEVNLRMTVENGVATLHGRLDELVEPDGLAAMLRGLGWISAGKDPLAKTLTSAFGRIPLDASIALQSSRLLLALGPSPVASAPTARGPWLATADPAQLLSVRWESSQMRALVAGWRTIWQRWGDTAAGRATRASDDTDLIGDLELIQRGLDRAGTRGSMRFWTDRGVHGRAESEGVPAAQPLQSDPISRLLPAGAIAVDADATTDLGTRLSELFQHLEDRLATRSLREMLPGDDTTTTPNQDRELAYYKHAAALRTLIHQRGPTVFAAGSALVVGGGGQLARVEVRERGKPERTYKDVPVPEVALIGTVRDPEAALAFMADVWSALATASYAAAGAKASPRATLIEAAAPLTGARARWFDFGWLEALAGTTLSGEGDFKPQIAMRDKTMVLSTSPRLARAVLSAYDAPGARLALPVPKAAAGTPATVLVGWSSYPCVPLARQAVNMAATLENVFLPGRTARPGPLARFGAWIPDVCRLVEGVTTMTTASSDHALYTVDVTAAPSLYGPPTPPKKLPPPWVPRPTP